MFWGKAVSQNKKGHLIGHIKVCPTHTHALALSQALLLIAPFKKCHRIFAVASTVMQTCCHIRTAFAEDMLAKLACLALS